MDWPGRVVRSMAEEFEVRGENSTSLSWVNHSWYWIEAVLKCLFLVIGSESLKFDNGSI